MNQISVYSLNTQQIWHFVCDDWVMASRSGRAIKPKTLVSNNIHADSNYMFWYRMYFNLVQVGREYHLYLSVLSRQPYNEFTRVQRAASCITFTLLAMFTSAVWYQLTAAGVIDNPVETYPTVIGLCNVISCTAFVSLVATIFRNVEMSSPNTKKQAPVVHGVTLNENMAKIRSTYQSAGDVFYDIADGWTDDAGMPYASSKLSIDVDKAYDSKTQLMMKDEDISHCQSGDVATMLLQQRMGRLKSVADEQDDIDMKYVSFLPT